ncbi:citramalate synthase [Natranaerofaba carboxydovora]|uniref:citramalate synthase n=1 Tax=Natranaerofaba carboxydovora TaxID=2742683 RepID=UPI001F13FDA0|nr:citramalate synthase [Natranaerofaba carboxydovora]UMZ73833.1 (R)-citramalate synthase [Natranaerofaba carboxydovora]
MRIQIYDTTLRDGSQGEGISFSINDKINILKKFDEFGIDYVEGGWPGSNPKDIEFFKTAKDIELKNTTLVAFGSTRKPDTPVEKDINVKYLLESGAKAITIFGKSWDLHVSKALDTTLEENLKMIEDSIKFLKDKGIKVFYDAEHFFDGFEANEEYALKTLITAQRAGADTITLCDTNGGIEPTRLEEIIKKVNEKISTPLGIHSHNDSGLAVANSMKAVQNGIVQVQGTVNGYGERCGNANLCTLIPNIILKLDRKCNFSKEKLKDITALSRFVAEVANISPPANSPYVGENAFAHKGGIHVSAVMKQNNTYEHIDPKIVGNDRKVLVSELSGKSNILQKAKEVNLNLNRNIPQTQKVLEKIKRMEHQGYQLEGAEASLKLLIWKTLNLYESFFELISFRVIVDNKEETFRDTEATVKIRVGDEVLLKAAEGNGPVNALDHALRKALEEFYPALKNISLVDYKVRVLEGTDGTGSKVRVLIESKNDKESWSTVGMSPNIIEASWIALVDSIEYGLMCEHDPGLVKMKEKMERLCS